jgi:hypothetical protein
MSIVSLLASDSWSASFTFTDLGEFATVSLITVKSNTSFLLWKLPSNSQCHAEMDHSCTHSFSLLILFEASLVPYKGIWEVLAVLSVSCSLVAWEISPGFAHVVETQPKYESRFFWTSMSPGLNRYVTYLALILPSDIQASAAANSSP